MPKSESPDGPYVVWTSRKEEGKARFYFWTGEAFTGDFSRAKIHARYADCIPTIWQGILWEKSAKLTKLGFKRLNTYPKHLVDQDISLAERGQKDVII